MSKLSNDLSKWIVHTRRNGSKHRYDLTKVQNEFVKSICHQHAKEIENILRDNNQPINIPTSKVTKVSTAIGPQQRKLLTAYAIAGSAGMTNFEAGEAARLLHTCYWKRCGELRRKGYIATTGKERYNPSSGYRQMIHVITAAGRKALENE